MSHRDICDNPAGSGEKCEAMNCLVCVRRICAWNKTPCPTCGSIDCISYVHTGFCQKTLAGLCDNKNCCEGHRSGAGGCCVLDELFEKVKLLEGMGVKFRAEGIREGLEMAVQGVYRYISYDGCRKKGNI